jgi:hypothetical protein
MMENEWQCFKLSNPTLTPGHFAQVKKSIIGEKGRVQSLESPATSEGPQCTLTDMNTIPKNRARSLMDHRLYFINHPKFKTRTHI